MKKEIRIILEEGKSNKAKGNCFEDLIRKLISIHMYEVRGNINFAGMEIDLIANHKHKQEVLYVECKAKEKVSSDELTKFCFNVSHKKADFGYFFRTRELEYQAGALLKELREDDRYKNLTFFEPNQIIKMLLDAKMVSEPIENLKGFDISKQILAVTYFGDYFIYLVNESNALPTKFIIVDAKKNNLVVSKDSIELLKNRINEIKDLSVIEKPKSYSAKEQSNEKKEIESISEVQESENWFDYLPASSSKHHFVGRDEIRTKILSFFKRVLNDKTKKRIFYLNGKSGWGKSSLVLEIKNRCRNKHYKKKFYGLAIDTRSANSDNFVALSLKKIINNATNDGFIKKDIFFNDITFTSNTDLFSSETMVKLLQKLNDEKKFLILIFDQFEDVFRKKDFFKTFYKFLSDVTDKKPNIIVGFSWKTDFLVHSGDPSYHTWQQAKEQAIEYTIDEFGEKEINGIIKQLENTVGELSKSLRNRIIESSQGLPWLTKKLCIHLLEQINSGIDNESLIESNLNIKDLFVKDEENLETNEYQALKLIAKRAYESNFFDESEVGDLIESKTISSLLNKRLIIRSGANYNIYWDIFRDYLVTGEIPTIGESYLLRQGVNLCLEVFLLFDNYSSETTETLLEKHMKPIGTESLNNIILELRNLGLIQKDGDKFSVTAGLEVTEKDFKKFITNKFQNYTPYLHLKRADLSRINKTDVISVLKNIFKQDFQDNTWDIYAKTLINWFHLSDLDINSKLYLPTKGRGDALIIKTQEQIDNFIPRSSLKEILEILPLVIDETALNRRFHRDLVLIGIINEHKILTDFGLELILADDDDEWKAILSEKILELPKMKHLSETLKANPKISAKKLVEIEEENFFDGNKKSSKQIYATKALTWLK